MSNLKYREARPKRTIEIKPIKNLINEKQTDEMIASEIEDIQSSLEKVKKELEQAEQKKYQLLEDTNSQIQLEKEKWAEEKKQLIEEAKQVGFEQGFDEGKAESLKLYDTALEQANGIVDLIKVDYQKTLERTEDVIIELAMHTAEKILQQKIEAHPEQFIDIVQAALKEIKNQSVISIHLHPTNYQTVLEQKDELKRILGMDTKLSIYVDDELSENGCIIEHPFGQIDASIDTQLEQIRDVLNELVMESKDGN